MRDVAQHHAQFGEARSHGLHRGQLGGAADQFQLEVFGDQLFQVGQEARVVRVIPARQSTADTAKELLAAKASGARQSRPTGEVPHQADDERSCAARSSTHWLSSTQGLASTTTVPVTP